MNVGKVSHGRTWDSNSGPLTRHSSALPIDCHVLNTIMLISKMKRNAPRLTSLFTKCLVDIFVNMMLHRVVITEYSRLVEKNLNFCSSGQAWHLRQPYHLKACWYVLTSLPVEVQTTIIIIIMQIL